MSLNRGMFFTLKNEEDRKLCHDVVSKSIKELEGIEDVVFMNDEEIINTGAALADVIKKNMAEFQTGVENPEKSIYEDPAFLEKFMKTVVINSVLETTVTKIVLVDRAHARNISDEELIQLFIKITGELKQDGMLHIPGNDEKLSQLNLFYSAKTNTVRIERNGVGAPAIALFICKNLSEEEKAIHEGQTQRIKKVMLPYNGAAQSFDDILAFVADEVYDEINIGISRNKEDKPILHTVKSLEELYDAVCLITAQMEFYGSLERDVIDLNHNIAASEVVPE